MKALKLLPLAILALFIICTQSCKEDEPSKTPVVETPKDTSAKDTVIMLSTSFGDMYLYMFKGTPLHRANFHKLVMTGFYDDTEFHRIIPGFVIQGGDPLSKDDNRANDGTGSNGYTVPAEINKTKYPHIKGSVGGASTAAKGPSSGCQFYISVAKTTNLDGNYTVFGQVIKGIEVADEIVKMPRNSKDLPNDRIKMKCKILSKTAAEIKSEFGFTAE